MAVYFNPNVVTRGLVLNLDAANRKSYAGSGSSWNDLAGNNGAILVNSPTFNQNNSGIITFDGVDDYAVTSSNLGISGANPRSMECWFFPKSIASKNIMGFGSESSGAMFDIMTSTFNASYYQVIVHYYGANNDTISTLPARNTLVQNVWNQVVVTYDSTTISVYTNGVLSNSKVATLNTTNSTLFVGKGIYASYNFISSDYSLCRVYNRALTPSEVLQNFNAVKGRFGI